jgi:hypothetical protein
MFLLKFLVSIFGVIVFTAGYFMLDNNVDQAYIRLFVGGLLILLPWGKMGKPTKAKTMKWSDNKVPTPRTKIKVNKPRF